VIKWFLRGAAHRRLTTRFPKRPEPAPPAFRARAVLDPERARGDLARRAAAVCLPGALSLDPSGRAGLDAARCIACGLCLEVGGDAVAIDRGYELAVRSRSRLVVGAETAPHAPRGHEHAPPGPEHAPRGTEHAPEPGEGPPRSVPLGGPFRRSLHIRHVDAGSDGAVEQELAALLGPHYDMHRLGLFFTASPRHADVLLVTGPVTLPMVEPLRRTYDAMPDPRVVIAAGTDACSGSFWTGPEALGGVDRVLPVDVYIPGDPPSPIALLHGLLLAAGHVAEAEPARLQPAAPGSGEHVAGGAA
jgi:Ni,Fe-hydrogenase III small subunit/formate hydrogenlyase subunit 6/NADH:ubiquinone oxidoreductase subunit I